MAPRSAWCAASACRVAADDAWRARRRDAPDPTRSRRVADGERPRALPSWRLARDRPDRRRAQHAAAGACDRPRCCRHARRAFAARTRTGVRAWRTRTRHGAGQRPANAIAGGDYDAVYSDAFNEHGDTGFQRVAQAGRNPQLPAAGGDVQQGTFVSVADAVFDLTGWSGVDGVGVMDLGLAGGVGERWTWSAEYALRFGTGPGIGAGSSACAATSDPLQVMKRPASRAFRLRIPHVRRRQ